MLSAIDWLTRASQKYPGSLAAVLCRNSAEAKYAYRLLQPTFGPLLRLGDEHSFTFYEGIVVASAEQVKGLEFTNVLLWNPSKERYPKDDMHRNLLYTAITRAEENLAVVTWNKPSEILPAFGSSYFRAFDLTIRDEGEQAERAEG
jgi:DNA helicase IV